MRPIVECSLASCWRFHGCLLAWWSLSDQNAHSPGCFLACWSCSLHLLYSAVLGGIDLPLDLGRSFDAWSGAWCCREGVCCCLFTSTFLVFHVWCPAKLIFGPHYLSFESGVFVLQGNGAGTAASFSRLKLFQSISWSFWHFPSLASAPCSFRHRELYRLKKASSDLSLNLGLSQYFYCFNFRSCERDLYKLFFLLTLSWAQWSFRVQSHKSGSFIFHWLVLNLGEGMDFSRLKLVSKIL